MSLLNWSNALSMAGGAAAQVGLEGVKATLEEDKIRLADQLATTREITREARQDARTDKAEARADVRQSKAFEQQGLLQQRGFDHSAELQKAGFGNDKVLLEARQKFDTEQKELDRGLTREQIQANKEIHAADRANSMAVAKMGGSVHVDPEGKVSMIGKDGTVRALVGTDGKPLMSAKDLTPAAKALSDTIKDRLKALDANALLPPEEKAKQEAVLNAQQLQVLTKGIAGLQTSEKAAGKTGFDTTTGEVWKDGVKVGKAKNAQEASTMIHSSAKTSAAKADTEPKKSEPVIGVSGGGYDFMATNPGLINWGKLAAPK